MITFSVGNLISVAFSFFFRTVASVDVFGGPEKGRYFRLSTYFNGRYLGVKDGGADLLSLGALNKWLQKSPAALWKSITRNTIELSSAKRC